jgi:hypothetical protein
LEVANAEFRVAFGTDADRFRPTSRVSIRTIRPSASLASLSHRNAVADEKGGVQFPILPPIESDVSTYPQQLLANLRLTSITIEHDTSDASIDHFESLLRETAEMGRSVIQHFRACVNDTISQSSEARATLDKLITLQDTVKAAAEENVSKRGLVPMQLTGRKRNRDSDDSQLTAVSRSASLLDGAKVVVQHTPPHSAIVKPVENRHVSISTDTAKRFGHFSLTWPEWLDPHALGTYSVTDSGEWLDVAEINQEPSDARSELVSDPDGRTGFLRRESSWKILMKKAKAEVNDEKTDGAQKKDFAISSTGKLKAWLKRKIMPDRAVKLEIVLDLDEEGCAVGREVKGSLPPTVPDGSYPSMDRVLRTSHIVLAAASRDLEAIRQCMTTVSVHF